MQNIFQKNPKTQTNKKPHTQRKEQLRYKFTDIGKAAHFLECFTNVSRYQFPVLPLYKANTVILFKAIFLCFDKSKLSQNVSEVIKKKPLPHLD